MAQSINTTVELSTNKVVFDIPRTDNLAEGKWVFWCEVTNSEGKVASSTELLLTTKERGT